MSGYKPKCHTCSGAACFMTICWIEISEEIVYKVLLGVSSILIIPLIMIQRKKTKEVLQFKSYCRITIWLNNITSFNLLL